MDKQNFISSKRITFSERFEKTRLAILSYSAISIVLSVASNHASAQMPGISGVQLNIVALRLLVFFAAAVYVFVFWKWDVPATETLNGNALDGVTWSELSKRFLDIEKDIIGRLSTAERYFNDFDTIKSEHARVIDKALNQLAQLEKFDIITNLADLAGKEAQYEQRERNGLLNWDRLGQEKRPSVYMTVEIDSRLKEMKSLLDVASATSFPDQERDAISRIEKAQKEQKESIGLALDKLKSLSDSLLPGEASRFRIWDCGAAYAIFALAGFLTVLSSVMFFFDYDFVWNLHPAHSAL